MAAGHGQGHMIFVQEFLMAVAPDEVEATFDALRDGMCPHPSRCLPQPAFTTEDIGTFLTTVVDELPG